MLCAAHAFRSIRQLSLPLLFAGLAGLSLLLSPERIWAADGQDRADKKSPDAADPHHLSIDSMDRSELTRAFAGQITVMPADDVPPGREVVFVDPSVPERDKLIRAIDNRARVIELRAGVDALSQIAAALAGEHDLAALHIISHGGEGRLKFAGSASVSLTTLPEQVAQLGAIRNAMRPGGDLLLYGCDVAKGEDGKFFVALLSQLTGDNVAASEHKTGARRRGGDWDLAYRVGHVKTQVFAPNAQEHYDAVLANVTVNTINDLDDGSDTGAFVSLRDAMKYATSGDTIVFTPALAGQTLKLMLTGDSSFGPSALAVPMPLGGGVFGPHTLTIDGSAAPGLVISGDTANASRNLRLFLVGGSGSLTLKNVTLANGRIVGNSGGSSKCGGAGGGSAGLGGAIFTAGTLTLYGCTLASNTAKGGAGGRCFVSGHPLNAYSAVIGGGGGGGLNAPGGAASYTTYSAGILNYGYSGNGGGPNGGVGLGDYVGSLRAGHYGVASGGGVGGGGAGGAGNCTQDGYGAPGGFGGGGGGAGYSNYNGNQHFNGGYGGFGGGGGGGSAGNGSGLPYGNGAYSDFGGGTGGNGNYGYYGGGGGGGAGLGGAIFKYGGTLKATNCTLTGNSASGGTGGRSYGGYNGNNGKGYGGAIFCRNGSSTILNCTIASNIANDGGALYVMGDHAAANLQLDNSILADSNTGNDFYAATIGGSFNPTGGHNLIETQTASHNIPALSSADPLLGTLANNGGPTQTMALTAGSPAIDVGDNTAVQSASVTLDQRGAARIINTTVDLGAVETLAAPVVSSVAVPNNGTYGAGQNLDFTINFSSTVVVTGTPQLALTIGSTTVQAAYLSGSNSSALVFRYAVLAGQLDTDGITVGALTLNGGTLQDTFGTNATLTLNSVGSTTSVLVDGQAPTLNSVAVPTNGNYTTGQNLDFTVAFSKAITVTGSPTLALTVGSTVRNAAYVSGSGSSALVFRYTVVSADNDSDGIALAGSIVLNGGTLNDHAGNAASLTLNGVGATAGVLVNAGSPPPPAAPTITTQPAGGSIFAGQTTSLSVVAGGSGLSYQWYVGQSGDTSSPVAGATDATFTTAALNVTTNFWVQVSNSGGSINSNTAAVAVLAAPVINSGSPTETLGSPTQFVVAGADNSSTVSWDFGDGTTASGASVSHKYAIAGVYTVTATLTDASGHTTTQTQTITIQAQAAPQPQPFTLLSAHFDIGRRRDSAMVKGLLHLPAGLTLADKTITFNVGGNSISFTLDGRAGHNGRNSVDIRAVTAAQNAAVDQTAVFVLHLDGALAQNWKSNSALDASGYPQQITVQVTFNGATLGNVVDVKFRGRAPIGAANVRP